MLKAFILAAGEASRFAPYSRLLEKSMLPLGGKPLVRIIAERLMSSLKAPASNIVICVLNKHLAQFEWEFRDLPGIQFVSAIMPLGTVGMYHEASLRAQMRDSDTALVHYADCYTEIDYGHFVSTFHRMERKPAAMIALSKQIRHDYSEVSMNTMTNLVTRIVEKPYLAYPTWTGIAVFDHASISSEFNLHTKDFGYDLLPRWAEQKKLAGYMVDALYADVGNANSYERLRAAFEKA